MSLFGSRKKNPKRGKPNLDLNTALSEGKIELLEGGKIEQDGLDVELFHIGALIEGTSESEINKLETIIFGKTFNDMLGEGYRPSIAIKDDEGAYWTASGKLKTI
ncbi:MAG: hypothetical protein NWE87_02915 [Candidatus Bathyarchaeota archaeon]|nr:hypothetical protein [Candidatus Bathyarchaeota archaeon]